MSDIDMKIPKPAYVIAVLILLYCKLGIRVSAVIREWLDWHELEIPAGVAFLGLSGFFIFMLGRGKNWARIATCVLWCLEILHVALDYPAGRNHSLFNAESEFGIFLAGWLITGFFLGMLFIKPSSTWFRQMSPSNSRWNNFFIASKLAVITYLIVATVTVILIKNLSGWWIFIAPPFGLLFFSFCGFALIIFWLKKNRLSVALIYLGLTIGLSCVCVFGYFAISESIENFERNQASVRSARKQALLNDFFNNTLVNEVSKIYPKAEIRRDSDKYYDIEIKLVGYTYGNEPNLVDEIVKWEDLKKTAPMLNCPFNISISYNFGEDDKSQREFAAIVLYNGSRTGVMNDVKITLDNYTLTSQPNFEKELITLENLKKEICLQGFEYNISASYYFGKSGMRGQYNKFARIDLIEANQVRRDYYFAKLLSDDVVLVEQRLREHLKQYYADFKISYNEYSYYFMVDIEAQLNEEDRQSEAKLWQDFMRDNNFNPKIVSVWVEYRYKDSGFGNYFVNKDDWR